MKKTVLMIVMFVLVLAGSLQAQVFGTTCSTLEQQQAAYNRTKASQIVVRDTASQQLQCYYQQLATYYQQLDKDNQQKAKDAQQIAKDAQQVGKDLQQIQTDKILCEKLKLLDDPLDNYDELDTFIQIILPMIGNCSPVLKDECQKIHNNRSGGGDGTNPGAHGNLQGFDNPGYIHKHS